MKTMGIADIQKNTAIFNNLSEVIEIEDKRKKQIVAIVYPVRKKNNIVSKLAGKYKDKVTKIGNIKSIKEAAMTEAMVEKYGYTD